MRNRILEDLISRGFDDSEPKVRDEYGRFSRAIRVQCSQCEALCINGHATHETGCPNTVREEEDD